MKTKTEKILAVMTFLAYLALIGFSIECGSQLVSLIISFKDPELAKKFYSVNESWDTLQQYNKWFYVFAMSIVIVIAAIKVSVWYLIIQLLSKLNLRNPFSIEVARKLQTISYQLLSVWILGVIGKLFIEWAAKRTGETYEAIGVANEYFFIAGIVYIISQIFMRGIEIQEENQLTV